MDALTARKCLDWLFALYPEKKIGVVWDYAGAHIDAGVRAHAESLGIVLEYINKGMTSVQQPCDLWANQPFKSFIKNKKYYEFRLSLNLSCQRKVQVPRELFVNWVEEGIVHLVNSQRLTREVAKTFSKCGLDPYDEEKVSFKQHLEKLANIDLYQSLLDRQTAVELA
jgi:hypothetical protein